MQWRINLIIIALLITQTAVAEQADRKLPVSVDADNVQMDDINKTALYQGNVVLQQGTLMVQANSLSMKQDAQGFSTATALGTPVYFRQKQDNSDEYVEGWADRLDLDNKKNTVLLTGHALLKNGANQLHANVMLYNSATQQFSAQRDESTRGSPRPDRVRTIMIPKPAVTPAAAPVKLQSDTEIAEPPAPDPISAPLPTATPVTISTPAEKLTPTAAAPTTPMATTPQ